jgi:hypothetical protein
MDATPKRVTAGEYIERLKGIIGDQQIKLAFLNEDLALAIHERDQAKQELMEQAARKEKEILDLKNELARTRMAAELAGG